MSISADQLWLSVVSICIILLVILIIVLWNKLNKARTDYEQIVNGTDGKNLEGIIIEIQQKINQMSSISENQVQMLHDFSKAISKMKSKLGVLRYSAFEMGGNNLSFSLAIIDEYMDGVVLSAIHNREESYLYVKPLLEGKSQYLLSPEEKEAINLALKME